MRRSISKLSLLFASISAIIGSGWLFAAYYTSLLAGPSAMFAWLIGGCITVVIAFSFAEISAMLPIMGSTTRIPQYTHGTLVSFTFSWIIWLSYVALAATEVQAVIQYMSYYFPNLTQLSGALTKEGYFAAVCLMFIISSINIISIHWLMRCNTALTWMKILIPTFMSVCILALFFSPKHFFHTTQAEFMPFGWHGILSAVSTGGIVFAFNGFKQACEMAGEAKNPGKAVPIAVIGSIVICLVIYLLLQLAFLSSLTPGNLNFGWAHINLPGSNSPFASILKQDHLLWLEPILYFGAIIGPLASGLMYCSSGGRSLYAMSRNDYLPIIFHRKNAQNIPWFSIVISGLAGLLLFAPLPGWKSMISFLASLMAISYASAPVALLTLRYQIPKMARPFRLPCASLITTSAFYFCNLLSYWSGWEVISKLGLMLLLGFVILFFYYTCTVRGRNIQLNLRSSVWLWPYLIGLSLISYLGNFGHGLGIIPFGWDFLILALFSIAIMMLAVAFRLPSQTTQDYIDTLTLH